MSAKAIREYDGKKLLSTHLTLSDSSHPVSDRAVQVTPTTDLDALAAANPWLKESKLVAKPDQLIKRRGKGGLLALNVSWDEAKAWIAERMQKEVQVEKVKGELNTFIVEPFVPHEASDEYYVCIISNRSGDEILFHHEGGVDIGDVDAKAVRHQVRIREFPTAATLASGLVSAVPEARRQAVANFIAALFSAYKALHFTYLEINPLVVVGTSVYALDLAAKLDQTAEFECANKWGEISFPPPFGRAAAPEEAYIADLDSKTGASLKLTILNANGRIWTMVAGGGASVAYADTISDLGFSHEMANYGEYSGAPSETLTFEYAKTILDLMTRTKRTEGKVLIIGGGIANFTNVAATFKGIVSALKLYAEKLVAHEVQIWVRRAGPNYQEGLKIMKGVSSEIGVPIHVYGPETHMPSIVPMALGLTPPTPEVFARRESANYTEDVLRGEVTVGDTTPAQRAVAALGIEPVPMDQLKNIEHVSRFTRETRCVVYGMQPRAVQGMLDFDQACGRKTPSVAAMIYPFGGDHFQKFYWGSKETLIPIYAKVGKALEKYPEVDTLVNFASCRSVYDSCLETLEFPQIKNIAIIAEGVPESRTKELIDVATSKKVNIIGPATVGGIKPGAFRIGNTGGMLDNIITSKLYRPGSVAYVSRSGGMSNELNNIISRFADGVYEGVAIGGDRYPGSTFIEHILRYQDDPNVKMLVLLGEVGGVEEYEIAKAVESGRISKPLVAWCLGTCASNFDYEVQFGHAGACAQGQSETADAKNKALKAAGAFVPSTFDKFGEVILEAYIKLVKEGTITPFIEPESPKIPVDYSWAQELGLVRKPASFVSTISDDRGEELLYAGMPISAVFKEDLGIGGVIGLLWFKRRLPPYCAKFIEYVLMVTADHGPAVSGAHNTIVTARAGKDLVSSLTAGLLTIGPRFGGAVDGAAEQFSRAFDAGLTPKQFVADMRKQNKLIMGIGHRVKSVNNPDLRVQIIKEFAKANFESTKLLDFALAVEELTTAKKANLILNVDGTIGVLFVDLLRSCGAFSSEEVEEYIHLGILNGLFVLGRSIGFIGHYLDQRRLKQGLYRHPWDDISYMLPEGMNPL